MLHGRDGTNALVKAFIGEEKYRTEIISLICSAEVIILLVCAQDLRSLLLQLSYSGTLMPSDDSSDIILDFS